MIYNLVFTLVYVAILLWIYDVEITHFWTYMRFEGDLNLHVALLAFSLSVMLAVLLPRKKSARGYIVVLAHYLFFLPSIVYLSFNNHHQDYPLSLAVAALCIYLGSAVQVPNFAAPAIRRSTLLSLLVSLIVAALLLQVFFGGLTNLNLDLEAVYNFRRETAAAMPAVMGYIFSNVAHVLIPASIVLALYLRSKLLAIGGLFSSAFLFGMSHHKSIIFVSLLTFGLYLLLQRTKYLPNLVILPLSLVGICALEVIYNVYVAPEREVSMITSYIVRRTLLVPPMLDVASVELFSEQARYYWSTSRLGLGFASNPHDLAAEFLMGRHFFNDPDMSANTGSIGSGYWHAGILGVFMYSIFTGLFISFVNMAGCRVGHPLAAAISVPVILIVLTTADLTTAVLSHGLLLLFLILLVIPRNKHFSNSETPRSS